MQLSLEHLFFKLLERRFVETHVSDKVMFDVVSKDKIHSKYRDAIKKQHNLKLLDNADLMVRFVLKDLANQEEDSKEEKPKENEEETKEEVKESDESSSKVYTYNQSETMGEVDLKTKLIQSIQKCLYLDPSNEDQ